MSMYFFAELARKGKAVLTSLVSGWLIIGVFFVSLSYTAALHFSLYSGQKFEQSQKLRTASSTAFKHVEKLEMNVAKDAVNNREFWAAGLFFKRFMIRNTIIQSLDLLLKI